MTRNNKYNKKKIVKKYLELLSKYDAIFLVKTLGLSSLKDRLIRSDLKKINSKMVSMKNSLAKVALSSTNFTKLQDLFTKSIIMICSDELVLLSKTLIRICDDSNNNLRIAGGLYLGAQVFKDDIIKFSKMLTISEARYRILSILDLVLRKTANILNGPSIRLIKILNTYCAKNNQQNL